MKKVIKLGRHNLDWKPIIIAFSNASNLSQIFFRIMNAKLTMLVTKSTTCSYLMQHVWVSNAFRLFPTPRHSIITIF